MKFFKVFLFFFFISYCCYSQSNESLLNSYYNVLKKGASGYIDTLKMFHINKSVLAIKIVEMDTSIQKLSFSVTDFVLCNEFNYLDPSFYFKIKDRFVLAKKNENGDFLQKKLNLAKVKKKIIKKIEKNLRLKNVSQVIHEPFASQCFFSNDTFKSIFYSRGFALPCQYQIIP